MAGGVWMEGLLKKAAVRLNYYIAIKNEELGCRTYPPNGGAVKVTESRSGAPAATAEVLLDNGNTEVEIYGGELCAGADVAKMKKEALLEFTTGTCEMCEDKRVCLFDTYNIHAGCKGRGIIFDEQKHEWVKCPDCFMGIVPYISINPMEKKCPACCWRY